MKIFQSTHDESQSVVVKSIWIPVEASAVLVLAATLLANPLFSRECAASTGSSWGSQPAWTSPSDSQPSRKPSYSRETRYAPRDNIAPFTPGSNNLALDVGQVFLMGDLGNHYDDSIGAQLHYTYGVSDLFGFDASAGYSGHSDGKFSMTTLLAGLRTNLSWYDKVVPYVVFGLGFYRPSLTLTNTTSSGAATETSLSPVLFGVHLGPGVDLELTKQFFFGAAITFHDVFGSEKTQQGTTVVNQDVGGTWTSFFLHVGMTF